MEHFSSDLKIVLQAVFDNVDDAAKRQDLMNIAKTTLSSKFAATNKELFANLAVDAVLRLKGSGNRDAIQVIKVVGGDLSLSFLDEGTHKTQSHILHVGAPKIVEKYFMHVRTILDSGFVTRGKENYVYEKESSSTICFSGFILKKRIGQNQPKRIENARIMVANTPMDADKVKVFGSKVKVDSIKKVAEIEEAEKQKMKDKVGRILKHDINVFVNRQLIYNYPEQVIIYQALLQISQDFFNTPQKLTGILKSLKSPDKSSYYFTIFFGGGRETARNLSDR